jgi:transposase-like protein
VRSGDFYPSALEKGTRTDQAVHLALAEMVVQGVFTRRVIGTIATLYRVWYDGKQPRPKVCSSLMKAGFPTILLPVVLLAVSACARRFMVWSTT